MLLNVVSYVSLSLGGLSVTPAPAEQGKAILPLEAQATCFFEQAELR